MATLNIKSVYEDDYTLNSTIELKEGVSASDVTDENVIAYSEWLCEKQVKAVFRDDTQIFPKEV